jgi:hypothetical protein
MIGFEISNVRTFEVSSPMGGINFRLIFDNREIRIAGSLPSGEGEAACCEVELHRANFIKRLRPVKRPVPQALVCSACRAIDPASLTNQGYVLANTRQEGHSFKSGVIARSMLEEGAREFSNCFPSEISSSSGVSNCLPGIRSDANPLT